MQPSKLKPIDRIQVPTMENELRPVYSSEQMADALESAMDAEKESLTNKSLVALIPAKRWREKIKEIRKE